nr:hypothetical protein CoNPh38_CDS0212 [Staphylococcus phage S-CoN_Ph38]
MRYRITTYTTTIFSSTWIFCNPFTIIPSI